MRHVRPAGTTEDSPSYFDLWRQARGYPWNKYTLLYTVKTSATQAKAACEAQGLTLASVLNAGEQKAMEAFGHQVWIGLTDADSEGRFTWTSGEPAWMYANWRGGQPNNNEENDCVMIEEGELDWRVTSCDSGELQASAGAYPLCSPIVQTPQQSACRNAETAGAVGVVDVADLLATLSMFGVQCY